MESYDARSERFRLNEPQTMPLQSTLKCCSPHPQYDWMNAELDFIDQVRIEKLRGQITTAEQQHVLARL